ncbi:MAG: hypothetical protein O7H41_08420 [Planctomycetota bacterium]|nr:hypothetical protein [Planctomycetota bacterium]
MTPSVIYIREIAEAMGCSRATAWRLAKSEALGQLYRLPTGRYFIKQVDFDAAIEAMAVKDTGEEKSRQKVRRPDLPKVPVELDRFMDGKPRLKGSPRRARRNGGG